MAALSNRQTLQFNSLISRFNDLIEDIRETIPNAQLYVEDGTNFYTVDGSAYEFETKAREGIELVRAKIVHCGCGGGW